MPYASYMPYLVCRRKMKQSGSGGLPTEEELARQRLTASSNSTTLRDVDASATNERNNDDNNNDDSNGDITSIPQLYLQALNNQRNPSIQARQPGRVPQDSEARRRRVLAMLERASEILREDEEETQGMSGDSSNTDNS